MLLLLMVIIMQNGESRGQQLLLSKYIFLITIEYIF